MQAHHRKDLARNMSPAKYRTFCKDNDLCPNLLMQRECGASSNSEARFSCYSKHSTVHDDFSAGAPKSIEPPTPSFVRAYLANYDCWREDEELVKVLDEVVAEYAEFVHFALAQDGF